MPIYGIDDEAVFNLLKWLSQEANVKLRLLQCGVPIPAIRRLVREAEGRPPSTARIDELLDERSQYAWATLLSTSTLGRTTALISTRMKRCDCL